jgi:hypothetical protein
MSRIKYGGATHCALKYAKMKNKPIGMEDLMEFFPTRFEKPSRVKDTMSVLSRCGFVREVKDKWQITPRGIEYLRGVAQTYRGSDA